MKRLKELENTGRLEEARKRLLDLALKENDYTTFSRLCRWRKRLKANGVASNLDRNVRVALLGGATTEFLQEPLGLMLEVLGLNTQIHSSSYNTAAWEMLSGNLAQDFQAEVVVVSNTPANIPRWPQPGDDLSSVRLTVKEVCDYWIELCTSVHQKTGCEVVLDNFHQLPTRPLGNLGAQVAWDGSNFLRRVNLELGDRIPPYVHIHDVEALASQYGVRQWFDARYWFTAKLPVSFQCAIPYVRSVARLIAALFGAQAKCLVLDLDNTIWGGVVGDDEVSGIAIGQGNPLAEAFTAFQDYLLQLKRRGVMLAVCSKNDEETARAPFRKLPEMVLKEEDFVAFKANWRPKPDNLREIAAELNIGLDTLVFVDDNPVERDHVRRRLPEVKVIDLTDDPADFPRLVDDAGWFEAASISYEDQERALLYANNAKRVRTKESMGDYASFLAHLEQKAVIRPFEERYIARITQLINKTNQFNLTTRRMTQSEVEHRMRDVDSLTAYVRLADRFGDNGLISVFIAHRERHALCIDQWLMSCRVFKREVEFLLWNYVAQKALQMGVPSVRGTYIPTPKNSLVQKHYSSLGFSCLNDQEDAFADWVFDLAKFKPKKVNIELVESY